MKTIVMRYSVGSKWLHWVIALLVIGMLSMGFFLSSLSEAIQPMAIMYHRSTGITILFLVLFRLYWLFCKGKPALPSHIPLWEKRLSHAVQASMYLCLLLMPLIGWAMSMAANHAPVFFGLFTMSIPGIPVDKALSNELFNLHRLFAYILIALISLHLLGVLKHQWIDKDKILQRML